jgi:hypothetical protein
VKFSHFALCSRPLLAQTLSPDTQNAPTNVNTESNPASSVPALSPWQQTRGGMETERYSKRRKKRKGQQDVPTPFSRATTDVAGTPPCRRRNGSTPTVMIFWKLFCCRFLKTAVRQFVDWVQRRSSATELSDSDYMNVYRKMDWTVIAACVASSVDDIYRRWTFDYRRSRDASVTESIPSAKASLRDNCVGLTAVCTWNGWLPYRAPVVSMKCPWFDYLIACAVLCGCISWKINVAGLRIWNIFHRFSRRPLTVKSFCENFVWRYAYLLQVQTCTFFSGSISVLCQDQIHRFLLPLNMAGNKGTLATLCSVSPILIERKPNA